MRLGVNIDHVATLRNARGGVQPDPIRAAIIASDAGADGITAHLREDRRHIKDNDIFRLKNEINLPLNFEMAATNEMLLIALKVKPNAVCIVPEKRAEITTEGGLDVVMQADYLREYIKPLKDAGIKISLFVDANITQIETAKEINADIVELHTGEYAHEFIKSGKLEFARIKTAAKYSTQIGLECHAGHGLCFETVPNIANISEIVELNIGHFIIGEAVFIGLAEVIKRMKGIITSNKE
jgi:pyridoxine 5-phosphate synthase